MKKNLSLFLSILFTAAAAAHAAESGEKVVAKDKAHHDGKPDYWIYSRHGQVYKREWDRNFDGKSDLRILEERDRLIEKQYDDNFDGKFEKIVKTPKKGSSGHTKTSPY